MAGAEAALNQISASPGCAGVCVADGVSAATAAAKADNVSGADFSEFYVVGGRRICSCSFTMASGGGPPMADYKIEPDGKLVIFLNARSTAGSEQSRDDSGAKLSFQSKQETAEFVRAGECHGFTFEGKEFLYNIGTSQRVSPIPARGK